MFEILLFGLPLFWYAFTIFAGIILFSLETDNGFVSSLAVIGFVLALWLFGDIGALFTLTGISTLLSLVVVYLFIGALWSVAKWLFFLWEAKAWYTKNKARMDDDLKRGYFEGNRYFRDHKDFPPRAARHKAQIMLWIAYWPFSMVWTLLNDPITRAVKAIYNALGGLMQRMSDRVFADTFDK